MVNRDSMVRRVDFQLRSEFIGLQTEIYKTNDYGYWIVLKNFCNRFDEISKMFSTSIRPAGEAIQVVVSVPAHWERKIEPISEQNMVSDFEGFLLNFNQLNLFVKSKFSSVPIVSLYENPEVRYHLLVEVIDLGELGPFDLNAVEGFLKKATPYRNINFLLVPNDYKDEITRLSKGLVCLNEVKPDPNNDAKFIIGVIDTDVNLIERFKEKLSNRWGNYTFVISVKEKPKDSVDWNRIFRVYLPKSGHLWTHLEEPFMRIETDYHLSNKEKDLVKRIIEAMNLAFQDIIFSVRNQPLQTDNISLNIRTYKEIPSSVRDSELWFDHAKNFYDGSFTKEQLYFYNEEKSKCYLDFSLFDNMNLRNQLLLYDVIYLTPPMEMNAETNLAAWLKKQKMSRDELFELIARGRIKLLLSNDETRYHPDLLSEISSVNPKALVTRRGIASLLACEFTELERQSLLSGLTPEEWTILYDLSLRAEAILESQQQTSATGWLFQLFTWPARAKQKSLELLSFGSPIRLATIGVHQVFPALTAKPEIEFELVANGPSIYTASALEATYFPFQSPDGTYSDKGVANVLGDLLNMYKYPKEGQRDTLINLKNLHQQEQHVIGLLELNEPVSILKFDDIATQYHTREKLKNLLMKLEMMNEDERRKHVDQLNGLLFEIGEGQQKRRVNGVDYLLGGAGLIPDIGLVFSLAGILKNAYKDIKNSDKKQVMKLIDKIGERQYNQQEKEEIYMLSKIDRAARLKVK
ncbi:hypothetical protein ACQKP0_15980 [Heyndrickxia sp. NPDC080065]|uniref:hypothetical protein n=1 Tax=Heyndrickxia sp. NPDC080065 TaxID=3390568 RepID=UPI003D069F7D